MEVSLLPFVFYANHSQHYETRVLFKNTRYVSERVFTNN